VALTIELAGAGEAHHAATDDEDVWRSLSHRCRTGHA